MVKERREVGGLSFERARRDAHVEIAGEREERTVNDEKRNGRGGARREEKEQTSAPGRLEKAAPGEHESGRGRPHEEAVEAPHPDREPGRAEEDRLAEAAEPQDVEAEGDGERNESRPEDAQDADAVETRLGPREEEGARERGPARAREAQEESARGPEREDAGERVGHVVAGGGRAREPRPRVADDGLGEITLGEAPGIRVGGEDAVVAVPGGAVLRISATPSRGRTSRWRDRRAGSPRAAARRGRAREESAPRRRGRERPSRSPSVQQKGAESAPGRERQRAHGSERPREAPSERPRASRADRRGRRPRGRRDARHASARRRRGRSASGKSVSSFAPDQRRSRTAGRRGARGGRRPRRGARPWRPRCRSRSCGRRRRGRIPKRARASGRREGRRSVALPRGPAGGRARARLRRPRAARGRPRPRGRGARLFQGNSSAYQPAVQPPKECPTKSIFSSARARARASMAATRPLRPKPAGSLRRLAQAGARRVGKDHGAAPPREEARGVRPVRRVGAEAVQEDDRPLRRERPEDERREGGSVVGGEDLAPRAGKGEALLLDRAIDRQGIHGDRAEEEEEERKRSPKGPRPASRLRVLIATAR